MATYDFSKLEARFQEIVDLMPNPFDSHEFLLALAQKYQVEYVEALYAYKDTINREKPAPFQAVHKAIIQKLKTHTDLVQLIREDKPSKDIFGNSQNCGEWKNIKKQ